MQQAGAVDFLNRKFALASEDLYTMLTHMMMPSADRDLAHQNLEKILRRAFRISLAMQSSPVEWYFDYPAADTRFDSRLHRNRDTVLHEPVITPLLHGAILLDVRIKIAMTPTIIKRDHGAQAHYIITVRDPDVLLTA